MLRPLFQRSTEELAALFDEWQNEPAKLRELFDELQHRSRPRAVELREQVEAAVGGSAQLIRATKHPDLPLPAKEGEPAQPAKAKAENEKVKLASNRTDSRPAPPRDEAEPYSKFTLIQPIPAAGRPLPFRPELKNDLRLAVLQDDSLAKIYRVALAELIREMKSRKIGHRQFSLEDGERLSIEAGGFSYQFEFTEDGNLFEGSRVELVIGGRSVAGNLTGLLQSRIIITLAEDFGPRIGMCILRIDNTALIQALHDRLQKIETGEVTAFRSDFATKVLRNDGDAQPPASLPKWNYGDLNFEQQQFVRVAFTNEITWLWGPPGTGKTKTLTALTRLLYNEGKRILLCSNTNQAVDQVLFQLCKEMRKAGDTALDEGRVVRLGRIDPDSDLHREFADMITIERIVARKSEALQRRKKEIEEGLRRLGEEVARAEAMLRRFVELDGAESALTAAHRELARAESEKKNAAETLGKATAAKATSQLELATWRDAGTLRRLFLQNEHALRHDLANAETQITKFVAAKKIAVERGEARRAAIGHAVAVVQEAQKAVVGQNRIALQGSVAKCDQKRQPLRDELAKIAAELEQIRESVLKEARIVGATVTRTYLRSTEFALFDTVIIDEASMILLPAIFLAAGLATERVVVAGDFRQLPPIVQTEQKAIHDWLAHDIFHVSGVGKAAAEGGHPRLVMLKKQFRMDDAICRLVSSAFYRGELVTSSDREALPFLLPEPFAQHLTIIDTSRVWPFCTRNLFQSRFNLMHALAIRNLVLHLHEAGRSKDAKGRGEIGLCSPYAAQVNLLKEILKSHSLEKLVRASTVHGFQGDERTVIVLDLVDSIGERNAGIFLQANLLGDSGAKLQNVAISRAKEAIIVVANLTFLDAKLPGDAILRGLLHDLQRAGRVVDVRDVLALRPVQEDLQRAGPQPEIDPEALRTGLFGGRDFAKLARLDIEQAKKSIVIFSGFITPDRVAAMGDLLRLKISQGVRVRCVTRPPRYNGSIPEEQGRAALEALEHLGVVVDLRGEIHEKVMLIDSRIAWFGSLNPLSHTSRTSELMARVDDMAFAHHLAGLLSIRRRPPSESAAESIVAENPRCEQCGNWSVFRRGRFGLYFSCEAQGCDWKQNIDAASRSARQAGRQPDSEDQEIDVAKKECPKCSSPMRKRSGRFGTFYSCSKYPKCDGKAKESSRRKKKS